ncbi:MAG: DUF58 domain-containing protein [Betaproteobacteria bacterium]
MPIPHRPLLWLVAAWLALGVATVFAAEAMVAWQAFGFGLLAVAVADAFAGRARRGGVTVVREVPHALPVGTWQTVSLHLTAPRGAAGWVRDRHPAGFPDEGLPLFFELAAGRRLKAGYRLLVTERGRQDFAAVDLRLCSPLRLWLIGETLPVKSRVRVYPNFARIAQYTLLATDNRLSQIGVLQRRRRGEGMEFHQLRDYRQEDSPRQIDWKASSRMGHLISREYQDERDQQIVFLLDCGSRMRAKDGELSHFDHTLNALLLLAYVALGQGDAVGMSTFGHAEPRYLPPKKSVATVNSLLNAVYDLQPTLATPDYLVAAEVLLKRLTKRALIVLVTNVRDEDDDTLGPAMALLRRKHAVTLASLREPVLDELTEMPVVDLEAALTRAAALEYLQSRRRQAAILRHGGIQILDASPHELPVRLINHYWERKRAGAI